MANLNIRPVIIKKELVPFLHFLQIDVLEKDSEREIRQEKLLKAAAAGNLHRAKVRIIFEDIHGRKEVVTTIWATTQEYIILKKGSTIPIGSVRDIQFI